MPVSAARIVPDAALPLLALTQANASSKQQPDQTGRKTAPWQEQPVVRAQIAHPNRAPSALPAEQFLFARQGLAPAYSHNIAATKIARISNLFADAPNFRSQLDIVA